MDLADDDERHHATRDDFLHLSDLEWSAVQRMAESIGNPAVGAKITHKYKNQFFFKDKRSKPSLAWTLVHL